ncbi:unnamed protein product [Durusdinium trenchii]|uniref:Uncharacterized protein n=1 Tax=Durusdinium trenchii TaxID=1381693 RepID=A0ABP0NTE6_9DINO
MRRVIDYIVKVRAVKPLSKTGILLLAHCQACNERGLLLHWASTSLFDVKLQPLSSFLQPFWNELNALPIDLWLINTATEEMDHRQRMKCLGNLVVPAQGALAMDILQRMRLEPNSLCAA